MNANRMIDTLEELIATAGMMNKDQIENAVQGSAVWVSANDQDLTIEELEKIDRLQERLLEKAA